MSTTIGARSPRGQPKARGLVPKNGAAAPAGATTGL